MTIISWAGVPDSSRDWLASSMRPCSSYKTYLNLVLLVKILKVRQNGQLFASYWNIKAIRYSWQRSFLILYLRRDKTCWACQRCDAAVMILQIVLSRNKTWDWPKTVMGCWNGWFFAGGWIQWGHSVVAGRKAEKTNSSKSSTNLNTFWKWLFSFFKRPPEMQKKYNLNNPVRNHWNAWNACDVGRDKDSNGPGPLFNVTDFYMSLYQWKNKVSGLKSSNPPFHCVIVLNNNT